MSTTPTEAPTQTGRSYDVTAPNSVAACDHHLPGFLRKFAQPLAEGENVTIPARITRLDKVDESYHCGCGVPAHWFVLRLSGSVHRVAGVIDEAVPAGSLDSEQVQSVARKVIAEVLR